MDDLPGAVLSYWDAAFGGSEVIAARAEFAITVNPALSRSRRVMILKEAGGRVRAALSPEIAARIGCRSAEALSELQFRARLSDAHVVLHEPDILLYLPKRWLLDAGDPGSAPRRLTEADRPAFELFTAQSAQADLDDAFVELDHWAVYGAFSRGRLVCVASMYPWDGSRIADLGVLTAPEHRREGHGRSVVQAISRHARDRGYEPQYRCQAANRASISLARAAGFIPVGSWEVITSDGPDDD